MKMRSKSRIVFFLAGSMVLLSQQAMAYDGSKRKIIFNFPQDATTYIEGNMYMGRALCMNYTRGDIQFMKYEKGSSGNASGPTSSPTLRIEENDVWNSICGNGEGHRVVYGLKFWRSTDALGFTCDIEYDRYFDSGEKKWKVTVKPSSPGPGQSVPAWERKCENIIGAAMCGGEDCHGTYAKDGGRYIDDNGGDIVITFAPNTLTGPGW
jgi:hypothetical protein